MLSHKFTTATPWLRDASAYTRIVFTIQVDVDRQGTHIRRTMRVVNEVHEIALVPNQLGETSDRDGDQDAALGFFEKLPIGAAGVSLPYCLHRNRTRQLTKLVNLARCGQGGK